MRRPVGLAVVAALAASLLMSTASAAPGDNLVKNAGMEAGAGNTFDCFQTAGWGANTPTLTAVAGRSGARAARLAVAARTSGDRKLVQTQNLACAPAVVAGETYAAGLWYRSSVPVTLTVFRRTDAGWTYWTDLRRGAPAVAGWTELKVNTPVIPAGTQQISFGMALNQDGWVETDDYSLPEAGGVAPPPPPPPPPPADGNLVKNPSVETGVGTPTCFRQAGWGTAATYGFSNDTPTGAGRSASVTIAGYVNGDRKLLTDYAADCMINVTQGTTYDFSVQYKSTSARQMMTAFRHDATGWHYWVDLKQLPAAAAWIKATATTPPIPAGTDAISVGVSNSRTGTLLTDDYSVTPTVVAPPPPPPPAGELARDGRWTVQQAPMPLKAVHSTLLRDGRVLLIAGSGNSGADFAAGKFETSVWNPTTGTFTAVPTPVDMFCAGHVTLADGRVLIMGGTQNYPDATRNYGGINDSYVFDPATNAYTKLNDTIEGHWYPTLTKLEDGDVWAAGGLREDTKGTVVTEMFDFQTMTWLPQAQVPQTYNYWGTYPHMYLLDDGRLFYSGAHTFGENVPGTGARLYNWRTAQMWDVPGLRDTRVRDQAGSVLLPPAQDQKIMIVGGGHTEAGLPSTNKVDIVDLSVDNPTYVAGPDLPGPGKHYVNTLNLPDRTVLATGGANGNRVGEIKTSAIYNPTANNWTAIPSDPIGRNYHSSALVLQDGRVAVFGSNPGDNSFERRISIYEPPYLFKGERPTITAAPANLTYGQAFDLGVTGTVTKVSLLAPGSATHQTDPNARLVDVPFTGAGATLRAQVSAVPGIVPPGPYMLTVTDDKGAVSLAQWVSVR